MYQQLKKIIKAIIPNKLLLANEEWMRRILFQLFYKGNNFECPICNSKVKKFIPLQNGEFLCPRCGSLQRNRRLWMVLKNYLKQDTRILDFSPSRSLYRKLKSYPNIQYTSTDFAGEFIADLRLDITNIDAPENNYDVIVCYHILEHIPEDTKAMKELFRILKSGGTCLIQTPLKDGVIYEDWNIRSPEQRKLHFGQEDHVRVYSIDGLKERLEKVGFEVDLKKYNEKPQNYYGLKQEEFVYVAYKRK